jgi:type I pantothenate kinase
VTNALVDLQALLRCGIERCRAEHVPCVIAITGSVAVGKSTTARLVQETLEELPEAPRIDLVSTDGFLFPNRVLDERGLTMRKGFPETYDRDSLLSFLARVKARAENLRVPVYSHDDYDVTDEYQVLAVGDVVIVEGLHLVGLSEAIDYAVYVDAEEADIERWYVERFLALVDAGHSFYRQFAGVAREETIAFARQVWTSVNAVNLHRYILPTRPHAHAVLEKGPDHSMRRVHRRVET